METIRIQIVVEQDEDGYFVAEAPALRACYAQGRTVDEAKENLREVIGMCLQELREDGEPINVRYPEVLSIETLEFAV